MEIFSAPPMVLQRDSSGNMILPPVGYFVRDAENVRKNTNFLSEIFFFRLIRKIYAMRIFARTRLVRPVVGTALEQEISEKFRSRNIGIFLRENNNEKRDIVAGIAIIIIISNNKLRSKLLFMRGREKR